MSTRVPGPEVGLQRVTVRLDLEADLDSVWRALVKIERFPEYMESVVAIRVLREDGALRTAEWTVRLRGSLLKWTETATLDAERRRIDFEQDDGDLSVFRGRWELCALSAARTHAHLDFEFEIGIPLLARMLNPIARTSLEENLNAMLRAVEACCREAPGVGR